MHHPPWRRDLLLWASLAALLLGAALVVVRAVPGLSPRRVVAVPEQAMQPEGGACVRVDLAPLIAEADFPFPFVVGRTDDPQHHRASGHRLLFNGEPLSMPHSMHDDIRAKGGERYSFWGGVLMMAPAADAPPGSYSVALTSQLSRWVVVPVILLQALPAAWLALRLRGRRLARALGALPVVAPVLLLSLAWWLPETTLAADWAPPAMAVTALLGGGLAWAAWATRRLGPGQGWHGTALRALRRWRRVLEAALLAQAGWRSAVCITSLVLLSLLRGWSPLPRPVHLWSGVQANSLLEGRMQASDSLGFLASAHWLRWTGELPGFGARRPLLPSLLAFEASLVDGRLQAMLLVNALLLAAALVLVTRAVARSLGGWAALAALAIMLGYAQHFVGLTLTEGLGMTLGALGVALLLPGALHRSTPLLAAGSFSLTLGLLVRAGAFFVLPALLLGILWIERRRPRRAAAVALACGGAMAGAVAINSLVFAITNDGSTSVNSNFAYVILGLARGGNWLDGQAWAAEQSALHPGATEGDLAKLMYAQAWREIRAQPTRFAATLAHALATFAHDWGPGLSAHFADRGIPGLRRFPGVIWGLLGLAALVLLRSIPARLRALLLPATLGVLASMPFLWTDGAWRTVAPTMPLMAVVAAIFLATGARRPRAPETIPAPADRFAAAIPALLALAMLAGALGVLGQRGEIEPTAGEGALVVIPAPCTLGAVVVEEHPCFHWLGPAHMSPEDLWRQISEWGVELPIEGVVPREGMLPRPVALAQYTTIDRTVGLGAGLAVAPPEFLRETASPTACRIEQIGASGYLGVIGRLLPPRAESSPAAAGAPP